MASSKGIDSLLKAEQEAAEIIRSAREFRLSRMKEAKSSAQEAIAEYRKTMEEEYQKGQTKDVSTEEFARQLKESTAKEVGEIDKAFEDKKQEVVDLLVGVVTSVKVEVSKDYAETLRAIYS